MYRGRVWTMRQFAGFGTPAETNDRYRFLLDQGQGGLSVAFDMPTLMGLDSDDPRSEGEVGRCGVATDSLDDFETLFDGIPLGDITTSMTISGPAPIAFAFFLATARAAGGGVGTPRRHAADRHPQGVHRAEGVALPAAPPPAADRRPDDVLRRARAEVPSDQRERLPHQGGGSDRGAGARVHAGRRLRLRRARPAARPRSHGVRAGAVVLLQQPHRPARGARRSSGPPAASGTAGSASATGSRMPMPGACGSTRRPQGCRTPRSSR